MGKAEPKRKSTFPCAASRSGRNVSLRRPRERALALPVRVMNDVHAAAYGEWRYGAGRGCDALVCLLVGTGIGGGVVAGGHFLLGHTGSAGEIGHMTIDLDGPPCSCGNRGCLEAFAGGWAIAERARRRLESQPSAGAPPRPPWGPDNGRGRRPAPG